VINVSQQTEVSDLLGGYKPVNTKLVAIPIQEVFENLFIATFSKKKNEKFSQILSKCFNKSQWKNVIKLWNEAFKMAKELLTKQDQDSDEDGAPKKKRKLKSHEKTILLDKWIELQAQIKDFEVHAVSLENSFVFNFVEGSLVKAVRDGEWLLLDEINLASSDTLESIADLLTSTIIERSILLTERGDIESIKAHPDFRIFGCMNPSTDVGKKDLPLSIRSRFSEIYVHSPDRDMHDLLMIVEKYIGRFAVGDDWVVNDVAQLYLEAKKLSESNKIVDGANQRPHFSIRTLTRTLTYVCDIVSIYGLRRSLYEGFCMAFLTLLDLKSEALLKPIIEEHTIGKLKNAKSVMSQCPPLPANDSENYVQFRHYWMKRGKQEIVPQPNYIITPFVEHNLLNLVRATSGRRFPVLVQGPTSAGKTSMIHYLANITGHKFVRINNHEHTDLQEYLGTYISDSTGKLTFQEGVLVKALREGHWIVLDELNLAPTDVLEALNRLLDDNRELFIPETQEVVRPHPDFMLFATQNPPGIYGGRKILSRAFRNRFLELHFDDIPQDELEIILKERCKIAPTYGKKIVEVYKELSVQRQSTRLFEQKNSFATLRDLFRWALRDAVGYEELAANGYMLLAERVRKDDEKMIVKQAIERVMKVKLDMDSYYEKLEDKAIMNLDSNIVWTKAMRRLAVLVSTSIKYNEPLLLVGETGCGKTTVCQIIAQYLQKELIIVNAHQNTETGDLLGAQRPVRNRYEVQSRLMNNLNTFFDSINSSVPVENYKLDEILKMFDNVESYDGASPEIIQAINDDRKISSLIFEWNDGPLIHAMKTGNFFLLDEISLADDSVLERLNSVLEPERSLLLAEKGTDDAFITAEQSFEFLATMNPGGDYGKKELSPALRNRFTEIWVPSMEDFNDVREIVTARLVSERANLVEPIVKFSEWYGKSFGGGNAQSGVISLRDILAWVNFINSCSAEMDSGAALLHGAAMVFIDALGTNNTAFLAENESKLKEQKYNCVSKLSGYFKEPLMEYYVQKLLVSLHDSKLTSGLFSVDIKSSEQVRDSFNLHAPTTAANAMRVIRAMQVHKPILLEGSPGVGKTSLVSAIAKSTGNSLIRINLSEQTDLVDLFGSDAPAEGGNTGEFVWRDAPFLRAMQKGEWVLLDEMNLASQSVLEGLNACLDHRGETYIPELDKTFTCHPEFKVFAAQNPQYQGGGRKGLPKSFVNRFTVVYVDTLSSEDLNLISNHLFPNIDKDTVAKMIEFMHALEKEVVIDKLWGTSGGPWEFNLRDTLRWLDLYSSKYVTEDLSPSDFISTIICQRFRTPEDRQKANSLFEKIFGTIVTRDNFYSISEQFVQAGGSLIRRKDHIQYCVGHSVPLECNFPFIESIIRGINHNLPVILTGPSNSGKTELIRFVANIVGAKVDEFAMNSEVDSMDILGGYEQVDLTRAISDLRKRLQVMLNELVVVNLAAVDKVESTMKQSLQFLRFVNFEIIGTKNYSTFHQFFKSYLTFYVDDALNALFAESEKLEKRIAQEKSVKFEWFDGLLVKAVENGNWLILDNASLCNPSVLDRLNSLLETGGQLIVNECSSESGEPRVIDPHPNFRLFLTVDPKYGELSRAMRNRGIELYLDSLSLRMTTFDKQIIGNITQCESETFDHSFKPTVSYLKANESKLRPFCIVDDVVSVGQVESSEMSNSALSLLSFSCLKDIPHWLETIQSSSTFNRKLVDIAMDIEERIDFLSKTGSLESLFEVFERVWSTVPDLFEGDMRLEFHQSIHPLINNYMTASFKKSSSYIASSEPTMFFELMSNLIKANSMILAVENNAMNNRVGDLSYLEKSAAFALGRNIKKHPRLSIYKFVKSVNEFILTVFKDGLKQLFGFENLYESIVNLQVIWLDMFNTSREQHESKLRVYQDLIREWTEVNCPKNELLSSYAKTLILAVDEFGASLHLTTGSSMSKLWEMFRNTYPLTENSWRNAELLFKLASEFDDIVKAQFGDNSEAVTGLREMLIELYKSIIAEEVNDEEFEKLYNELNSGISKLREVSEKFIFKRDNSFVEEFTLLSNYVQTKMIDSGISDYSSILDLSSYSKNTTLSLLKLTFENFKPYPSILKDLWSNKNGKFSSRVSGLFLNDMVYKLLEKAENFNSTQGYLLEQKLCDVKTLGAQLIKNSNAVLSDQRSLFSSLIFEWYRKVLLAHLQTFEGLESEELIQILKEENLTKTTVSKLYEIVQNSVDLTLIQVSEKFLFPALLLLVEALTLEQIGKAWILFSCGLIQLYVPNTPHDPAIREHVLYQKLQKQKQIFDDIIDSWKSCRTVISGDESIYVESFNPKLESLIKPRVYRPQKSIDGLFEEWKAFMESTIDAGPVEKLLVSLEENSKDSSRMVEMFQDNSSQFLERLSRNHLTFSDLNDILEGYVYGLKLGFDLLTISQRNSNSLGFERLWTVDVAKIATENSVVSVFPAAKELSKNLGVDSNESELIMLFFLKLCFAHGIENNSSIEQVFHDALEILYYRWTLRRMKEEEENAQSGSWFKYTDPDEDIEGDFKAMFPDYEEIVDMEQGMSKKNESFQEVYYEIAKLYIHAFTKEKVIDISDLVKTGSTVSVSINKSTAQLMSNETDASQFSALVWKLSQAYKEVQIHNSDVDFYHGVSPAESKRGVAIVSKIYVSVLKLLESWPEHASLQNIATASMEYLQYSLRYPVARCLQKIEQIYTFIAEWEKYASSQVTLKEHFDNLTQLIISWRKLELSTWKSLFRNEEIALEKNIGKWWFHLFETIVIPLVSTDEDDEESPSKLLSALNIFMVKANYGEFEIRLNLLKAFNSHVYSLYPQSLVFNALSNFILFYEQFASSIRDKISETKAKLEKDINEVILLASWKDVNIDALKQSSRRSHNSLYKIVRKYRALLATSLTPIFETGISPEIKVTYTLKDLPTIRGQVTDMDTSKICAQISSWSERPKRLQDMTLVNKNMEIYVSRISEESFPNLYDYAQEIQQEMERLRNETPSVLKEENKKLVAALKTQKRKLLSDTIRELRRIGLKTNLRADIIKLQSSINMILTNSHTFSYTSLDGSDSYFYRILDLLSRLRHAVTTTAEDVPHVDIEKGMAATENLIHSLMVTREPITRLALGISELEELYARLEELSSAGVNKVSVARATLVESAQLNLSQISKVLEWLPKLLEFAIQTIQISDIFGTSGSVDVFLKAKLDLSELSNGISSHIVSVVTEITLDFIDKFRVYYNDLERDLVTWRSSHPQFAFVADVILNWMSNVSKISVESSTSLSGLKTVQNAEFEFRQLASSILVAVQKTIEFQEGDITVEDDQWLVLSQQRMFKYVKGINCKRINTKLANCLRLIKEIEYNSESSAMVSALVSFTMPLVSNYFKMALVIFKRTRNNYLSTSRATYVLATSLHTLATKGFCSPEPPSEEKEDNNLHDGTGLGDGEGADNHSNDVGDDEDLSEHAQQPNEENKDKDEGEEENDDAVDIEGDMAGNLEEASDQDMSDDEENEKDEEDLDEEVDDIDDLDPNAVDEKMWDEEAKEDNKEKDSDKMPENSNNDDEMEANEDESEDKKNPQETENNDAPQDDENEKNEEDENAEDENDVGEQDDEVKNQENEQLEENVPETETLDLPDDLDIGDDGDDKEDEGEEFDDQMDEDVEDVNQEKEDDDHKNEEDEEAEGENEEEMAQDNDVEMQNEDDEEPQNENEQGEDSNADPEIDEDGMDSDEEVAKDESKEEENNEGGNDKNDLEQEAAEGVDGANDENTDDDTNMESAVKQEVGEKGEGADNQVMEENEDIGATGGASADPQQQEQSDNTNQDESRDEARESMKQLGDSLKEFHRRRQEIKEAKLEQEEKVPESAKERPDEFQHVEGENTDFDTQALGAADKDQVQSIDDDNAIDDDLDVDNEQLQAPDNEDTKVKEEHEEEGKDENDNDGDADLEGKTSSVVGERKDKQEPDEEFNLNREIEEIDINDEDEEMEIGDLNSTVSEIPPIDADIARELWRHSELATQELASGLCEQLRLILEPTLATKLKGDYKTGKRLNMKRIIPYIASEFRKDKIWLRRTKPSKRQFQIMIAVDDSKSMSESKSTELAFHSIALVSKALTQLESGGLTIVRFGEDVKVVHPFDKPFNNQESGTKIFQWFDFQQTRTDIKQLCSRSFEIFEQAKSSVNSDLWQLQIILSDGVCEDHETIQRLVRKAREERIMMVFVVIDGINSNESILDMSQVSYVQDPNTNAMTLKVDKYLDTFPFEYYVVVRNIKELPEMLALILRQYFSEVANC
jgi:midasin